MPHDADPDLSRRVAAATGASRADPGARIQSLWSGYGEIRRYHLTGGPSATVVAKVVDGAAARAAPGRHPRGWSTDRSHARKLRSYRVEAAFYRTWAERAPVARTARVHALDVDRTPWLLVLEDLDASGFAGRRDELSGADLDPCLRWLAAFHAAHLDAVPVDLWEQGSYWHLATRPDELARLAPDDPLRAAAVALDARLRSARHRTLIHGDAKVANFCFSAAGDDVAVVDFQYVGGGCGVPDVADLPSASVTEVAAVDFQYVGGGCGVPDVADQPSASVTEVAAVDFQYVGGGCGVQDVAYFLGSCLDEAGLDREAERHLDRYFEALRAALEPSVGRERAADVEAEWRALYPIAWADFSRFLAGWAPTHRKLHGYSAAMVGLAFDLLHGP